MGLLRCVVVQLCVCAWASSAIVPTTYRPLTYNISRVQGRELRFIQKRPVHTFSNQVNTTYRLFGKTYFIQPDGSRIEINDESKPLVIKVSKYPTETTTSEPESTLNESNQTDMLASLSNSIPFLTDVIPKPDSDSNEIETPEKEEEKKEEPPTVTEPSPTVTPHIEEVETTTYVAEEPESDFENEETVESEKDVGRWTSGELSFDEVVRTGAMVVEARGVSTAFLDAVSIIYECVRNYWNSGIVTCLTQRTARLLDAALNSSRGKEAVDEEDGDLRPRDGDLQEDTSQGRKKVFKKLFHPMGLMLRLKFLFVLIAVAVLAGKAAVLSFGSFAMTLMMYLRKHPNPSHPHSDFGHVTVYPQPSFHNKRYDDPTVVNSLTGGRDFYM